MKRITPDDPRLPGLRRFDARIDRLAARLWGRKPRRNVLVVFMLGRGDLILFSYIVERLRGVLAPGERLDILVRRGYQDTAFTLPGDLRIDSMPVGRFLGRGPTRLFWSLRIARRRYRRALLFDSNHALMRDERLAGLAAGEAVDIAVLYVQHHDTDRPLAFPPARYFFNHDRRHVLDHWAAFAAYLTGVAPAPVTAALALGLIAVPERGRRPHVVLHPFPGFASKFFRPEVYAPLLDALAETHDVLVSTGPRDMQIHRRMRALADWPHVRFVRRSLEEMAGLACTADLVISVDTALAHLAIGCRAPTLVLHNTDDTGVYMPYPPHADVPHARFLEIPADPAAPRRGWQPRRIWKAAPGTPERVRDVALAMLPARNP